MLRNEAIYRRFIYEPYKSLRYATLPDVLIFSAALTVSVFGMPVERVDEKNGVEKKKNSNNS